MEIKEQVHQSRCHYQLSGRFDAHQVALFKTKLSAASGKIVLDLADVNFIDSTGLASLVSLFKRTKAEGSELEIINVQDQVRLIFEITHLHTVLPLKFYA